MSESDRREAGSTEAAGPPLPLFGAEDRVPERIGEFRILDLVAKGMSLVYKAQQDQPSRVVALKIPRGGKLLSPEARERFRREVALASQMEHAGIVPVLEAGEIDGMPYYTMPFIDGRALNHHVEMERPDLEGRLAIFTRLCDVVQALHAEKLVHRDLKPENVMVDKHGDVRLLDFGLAKALAASDTLSGDQALLGTLQCMAPEQTLPGAAREITPATDVYALGMILYWLLTGGYPYAVDGSRDEALRNIRECRPPRPSYRRTGIVGALDELALACLEKDPRRRPADAGTLARELRRVFAGKSGIQSPAPEDRRLRPWMFVGAGLAAMGMVLLVYKWPQGPKRIEAPGEPGAGVVTDAVSAIAQADPVRMRVYEADEVRAMGGERAGRPADASVPAALWPIHQKTLAALRDEFALRDCGAVLVQIARAGGGWSRGQLIWSDIAGESLGGQETSPGMVVVLFLRAGKTYTLEHEAADRKTRATLSVNRARISCVHMDG